MDYACMYTSRASNLGLVSPQRPFRPVRDKMPHDHFLEGLWLKCDILFYWSALSLSCQYSALLCLLLHFSVLLCSTLWLHCTVSSWQRITMHYTALRCSASFSTIVVIMYGLFPEQRLRRNRSREKHRVEEQNRKWKRIEENEREEKK